MIRNLSGRVGGMETRLPAFVVFVKVAGDELWRNALDESEGGEMFKGLGDMASLMKQASQMKGMVGEMQEKLGCVRVTGMAGGGMVQVEVSGHQKVLSCTIAENLAASDDREMIEDLVVAATNQAMEKAREAAAAEMNQLAGGLDMPGLSDALNQFTGGNLPTA